MLRDKNLIPLSRQHQHALALCVRIDRASPIPDADLEAWRAEIRQQFQSEIRIHFAAEESVVFPMVRKFPELANLADELCRDHSRLREDFAKAHSGAMSAQGLLSFAQRLSAHIRKEERQLFERMQELMGPEELANLGTKLEDALKDAAQACAVPSEATRLRPAK
jgi:iron-sulfur cluster repair protein YtfE (RIC family)